MVVKIELPARTFTENGVHLAERGRFIKIRQLTAPKGKFPEGAWVTEEFAVRNIVGQLAKRYVKQERLATPEEIKMAQKVTFGKELET